MTLASIIAPGAGAFKELSMAWDSVWQALVRVVQALVVDLPKFSITFDRLHLGSDGTVIIVGSPSIKDVGQFKELNSILFKAEKWWYNASAAPVIGRFEPSSYTPLQIPAVQNSLPALAGQPTIDVEEVWLIRYSNRRIDPALDLLDCERISLEADARRSA